MDKSLFIYILVGFAFFYVVTTFVGDIQAEDDRYRNKSYNNEHQYDKYKSIDSVGQGILNVKNIEPLEQLKAWNSSDIKEEWIRLFPDFSTMKVFISDRIEGEFLIKKLNLLLDDAEYKYLSGRLNTQQTKQLLDSLK